MMPGKLSSRGVATLLGVTAFSLTLGYTWLVGARTAAPGEVIPDSIPPGAPAWTPNQEPASLKHLAEADAGSSGAAQDVEALVAGTESPHPQVRLASIQALADAPRDRAVPALVRISRLGPETDDRKAALDSLRIQALRHGDAEDEIHGALRDLVYDGNDEAASDHASLLLDELNNSGQP